MSKIIKNLFKFLKANIGLILVTIISVIWVLFKQPLVSIEFIKKIEPILDSVALGIVSSDVFYYFTVYIPERNKSKKIRKQVLSNTYDLKNVFFEYKNHLDNLKEVESKTQQETKEHLLLLDSKENLIDIYLNNINILNNLYINNEDLNTYINLYNEAKFKQKPYRSDLQSYIAYYKSMKHKIEDIIKSCDRDLYLD